jgi:DedD protein
MAKQTTDEESNLKRHNRRRLIGAIALMLVVIILLPVVFDSEPAPSTGRNIDLRIPDKDSAPEFQPKIDLPELDKMASEADAASAVANVPAASPPPKQKPSAHVAGKPAPRPKPVPRAKPEPAPKPRVEKKPVVQPAIPKTGFAVQVGAFAHEDTAKGIQANLSKQGYHAYTEKAGSVVRVRIGSYPTRAAAEEVRKKLESQGMQSNVVSLE